MNIKKMMQIIIKKKDNYHFKDYKLLRNENNSGEYVANKKKLFNYEKKNHIYLVNI